jgi:hypothetical protein
MIRVALNTQSRAEGILGIVLHQVLVGIHQARHVPMAVKEVINLKTAVEPRRRGEREEKQGRNNRWQFTFWVNRGAVKKPYCVKRFAPFLNFNSRI